MLQRKVHRSPLAAPDRPGPPWRLLVESPEPGMTISNFDAFRSAGFEVTVCEGPTDDPGECPVVHGEPCPLMTGADVVLFDLDSDSANRPPPRRERWSDDEVSVQGDLDHDPRVVRELGESVAQSAAHAVLAREVPAPRGDHEADLDVERTGNLAHPQYRLR
jgi:hypothetical protein